MVETRVVRGTVAYVLWANSRRLLPLNLPSVYIHLKFVNQRKACVVTNSRKPSMRLLPVVLRPCAMSHQQRVEDPRAAR